MLMKMRSRMQNQKGFTLVELMVVVVILGILVAIAVPVYGSVQDNARNKASLADNRIVVGAVQMYQAGTADGSLPGADADILPYISGDALPTGTTVTYTGTPVTSVTVTSVSTAKTPVTTTKTIP